MTTKILRIDASARGDASVTRGLNDKIQARFSETGPVEVTERDLSHPLPQIDGIWMGATFTPEADRSDDQIGALALSDELIAEVQDADVLLIGLPIYNFGVPAGLKTWIDQISRAGVTFRYTPEGPEGLLTGKRAIVSVASGGTKVGSEYDFATSYLRHVLGFVGITDVSFVAADGMAQDAEASLSAASSQIEELPLAA